MINVNVKIEDDVLAALADASTRYPGIYNTAVKRNTTRLMNRMLEELRATPGAPKYPLQWASDKQRRFVMAKLRREGNLPYRRTGALEKSWRADVVLSEGSGTFSVVNDDPSSIYVQGDYAQPMHLATGWPQAAPIISKYADQLESILIDTWYTIIDGT